MNLNRPEIIAKCKTSINYSFSRYIQELDNQNHNKIQKLNELKGFMTLKSKKVANLSQVKFNRAYVQL